MTTTQRRWLTVVALAVLAGPVRAQQDVAPRMAPGAWIVADEPAYPVGQLQFNSGGGLLCDGLTYNLPTYQFPVAVMITEACIWQGSDGAPASWNYPAVDLFGVLYASRPRNFKLQQTPEDRYGPPNGTNGERCKKREHVLAAGDQIGGGFFCAQLFGMVSHTHAGFTIEYRKLP